MTFKLLPQLTRATSLLFISVLSGAFFISQNINRAAAEGCGTITFLSGSTEEITDCVNPFATNTGAQNGYLIIDGQEVRDGGSVSVNVVSLKVNIIERGFFNLSSLFRQTENGYEEIADRVTYVNEIPEEYFSLALRDFFPGITEELIQLYVTYEYTSDPGSLSDEQFDDLDNFYDSYAYESLLFPYLPNLSPGNFVAVFKGGAPCVSLTDEKSIFTKLFSVFIKTAHAQCPTEPDISTLSFTISLATPEPTGASSILFLPGIQASRLYEDGFLFGEDRLWEPNFIFDADTKKLAMDKNGESVEDVYTKDILEYIGDDPDKPVYGGFIDFLESLVGDGVINEFSAFPYDWRLDVNDIVERGTKNGIDILYPTDAVEQLAFGSKSGKVTIVGHSNGGLLGKALISKLKEEGKENLVDKLIMLGTPQLGTPKAIGSLLHGYDQGIKALGDLVPVVSDTTARFVTANMLGAYGLLPGEQYLRETKEPVLEFILGSSTEEIIEAYGDKISTQSDLDNFLADKKDAREDASNIREAFTLSAYLLDKARSTRAEQDTWQAPSDIEVFTLAGTGRDTVRGFRFEPILEKRCSNASLCAEFKEYVLVPLITTDGDQTVIAKSAFGNSNLDQDRYVVDLGKLRNDKKADFVHYNFTEAAPVQNFVVSVIKSESLTDEYINELSTSQDLEKKMIGTHSPVYLYIEDDAGRMTGRLSENEYKQEIPDTEYISLAESSYIIVPNGVDYKVHIISYDYGSVTVTLHDLEDEDQPLVQSVYVASISDQTIISSNFINDILDDLLIDEDGDRALDYSLSFAGLKTTFTTSTPAIISRSSSATKVGLRAPSPQVAGATTSSLFATNNLSWLELYNLLEQIKLRLLSLR